MATAAQIEADYGDEIAEAVERFGDHEDMSTGRIVRWIAQFDDPDLPLALDVVEAIRYINATNLRAMTRQLFDLAVSELDARGLNRAAFVAVGDQGSGAGVVARVLRDEVRGTNHRWMSMLNLSKAGPGDFDAVIFVDDFSGTGESLAWWWEAVESLVRPLEAAVFVGLLVLNPPAADLIEEFADVLAVEELDSDSNALRPDSTLFTAPQKARIRDYCGRTGIDEEYRAGYGDCGLLLAFKHGCPDNSLPILWVKSNDWRPLFQRRAI